MNYRHAFHAGNFVDVFKHIVLVALIKSFFRKDTPFCFQDTHAGTGVYDLLSENAQKSKEFENGITKIMAADCSLPLIQEYKSLVRAVNPTNTLQYYPGSPEIVRQLLRPEDRMVLSELHEEEYLNLKKYFARQKKEKQIAIHLQDGYQSLKAFLPPKEKRGLILIDPPYENPNELEEIIERIPHALKRFETGVYAIWYPIKHYAQIERFHHAMKSNIERPMLITELSIYPENIATHLNGSGLLIINPPWQLDREIEALLPFLWETLKTSRDGRTSVKLL